MIPRIYEVENIGSGFLAVMAKPVSGEWIEDEFSGLAKLGILQIVSLLKPSEEYEVGLASEKELCQKNNIKFTSYPIEDRGLPASIKEFTNITKSIYHEIAGGMNTVIHCRAGIGRTGIVAAGVLLHAAFEVNEAFERISKVRGVQVPDTQEQYNWVLANQNEIINNANQNSL